jgi:hypothetical protein
VSGVNLVSKRYPLLWLFLLGVGLGQVGPALAKTPVNPVSLGPNSPAAQQTLIDPQRGSTPLLLTQAIPTSVKSSQGSAVKSLERLAERYRCAAPKADLNSSSQSNHRFEMAALFASCLESLGDRPLNAQEQSTIRTLRSEFKLELAALQGSQADIIRLRQSIDPNPGTSASIGSSIRWVRGQDLDSLLLHQQDDAAPNRVGIKAEANFGKIGVFGRYTVAAGTPLALPDGSTLTRNDLSASPLGDRSFENWSAGIGIRGFIIPKSVLALTAGHTVANPLGQSNPINYGAFYQFPIGDRLTVSPSVVIISNPNNPSDPDIQGAVQASFSF